MAAATEQKLPIDPKYDSYDFPTTAAEAQPGHPGHTTPEQDEKVLKLREDLEKDGYTERLDTLTLLRFLRARKFDLAASKAMFVGCEKWRKEFGTDTLPATFDYKEKAEVSKFYPQYYHKTDKVGDQIHMRSF